MDKEEFLKLADDPRHIPGIYNYCDRWCDRCPLTARCLNFALEKESETRSEGLDISNDYFWKKISASLQAAFDLLQNLAAEEGIDLETLEVEEPEQEKEPLHILIPMARRYGVMVDDWLQNLESEAEANPGEPQNPYSLKRVGGPTPVRPSVREEALEVIGWYRLFLPPKLARALNGRQEEDIPEMADLPKEADGSAKIALIAMDRSLGAWGELSNQMDTQRGAIGKIVAYLKRLREITEKEFPQARTFLRPGFDTPSPEDL